MHCNSRTAGLARSQPARLLTATKHSICELQTGQSSLMNSSTCESKTHPHGKENTALRILLQDTLQYACPHSITGLSLILPGPGASKTLPLRSQYMLCSMQLSPEHVSSPLVLLTTRSPRRGMYPPSPPMGTERKLVSKSRALVCRPAGQRGAAASGSRECMLS